VLSEFDKTTWKCEVCREIGEQERRGCGALKDYPVLMIKGEKIYHCPVGSQADIQLLFAYLSAAFANVISPPEPSLFWLRAAQTYQSALSIAMTKKASATDGQQNSRGITPRS
jgi:hypothetical protein